MAENIITDSLFRLVIDGLNEGVAICDKDAKLVYFNAAAEKILGMGLMQSSPKDWAKQYGVYHPDKVTPFREDNYPLIRSLKGEQVHNVLQYIQNLKIKDGIFITVSGSPIRDANNTIIGAVAIFTDVTQNVKNEEELKSREQTERQLNELFIDREKKMSELKTQLEQCKQESSKKNNT